MIADLMVVAPVASFLFLFAVVFQVIKFKSRLFYVLLAISSPLHVLSIYQALRGLASGSMLWVMFLVLVVVVILLVKNRLGQ